MTETERQLLLELAELRINELEDTQNPITAQYLRVLTERITKEEPKDGNG